jgi:hypothetical protein
VTTNFPSSIDNFTNPTTSDTLASVSHSAQHADVNDAVEALESKVGVDGSADTGSLDYKVANQGLTFIKSQTIGSGVSSVTVDNVFSSTFNNYKIMYAVTSSVNSGIGLRISGETSSTGYDSKLFYASIYSTAAWTEVGHFDTDEWFIGYTNQSVRAMGSIEMYEPYENNRPRFSCQFSSYVAGVSNGSTVAATGTQSTGFTLLPITGTFATGTIWVYGYNNG